MRTFLVAAAGVMALMMASQANAAITIEAGSFGTSGGVHSDPGQSADTVTGTVNGGELVTLSSLTDVIDTSGGGESVFAAHDGSMQQFTIQFTDAYSEVTFDIFKPTDGETAWTLSANGTALDLTGFTPLTKNANKFIVNGNGVGITNLTFTFTPGEQDMREIRVGDKIIPTGGVPEPASWALMILGFGGVGAALRGRRRQMDADALV